MEKKQKKLLQKQIAYTLGKNIKRLRYEKRFILRELEAETGIDKGYSSRLQTGKTSNPSFFSIYMFARALGVTMDELLEGYDD